MKVLVAVVVIAFLASVKAITPEQQAKLKRYYGECVTESGVNEELVKIARKGEFTEDEKLKQFVHCFFKKIGFQNEAGELQLDVIRAKIPANVDPHDADDVIAKCKDVKGTCPADTAFQLFKCYWYAAPTHISLAIYV